jgi:hypothetical protein
MNGATTPSIQPGSPEADALQAILNVLATSTSPEVVQAQAILLRRLALEGDVTPSRIPAPLNITEIGGYINLLATLGMTDTRTQMLTSVLGVAGPTPAMGWLPAQPTLAWLSLPNDRPPGPQQGTIPLTFQARSDFAGPVQLALQGLHDRGCALPIVAPVQTLPAAGTALPSDFLSLLGRSFVLVPGLALANPDTDPIAIAQLPGGPWQVASRCLSAGPVGVNAQQWSALVCSTTSCTVSPSPVAGRQYVPVAPVLATAGFAPAVPGAQPASSTDLGWARFTNVSGLVPGVTTLGSELTLLYPQSAIAASALAGLAGYTWDGATFRSQ